MSALLSALHLLALALGLPAVFLRGRALKGTLDEAGLRRLFAADGVWGAAALLWITTGPLRAFAGFEKGTSFYVASKLFWAKMALFATILLLEIRPMTTLMRWRRIRRGGGMPDTSGARGLYALNHVELVITVAMVFVASFMARGYGLG